jgi:hypothetical protein
VLSIDDALSDERFDEKVDCVPGVQTRSMLVVPVKALTGRFGVIALLQAVSHRHPNSGPCHGRATPLLSHALAIQTHGLATAEQRRC